MDSIIELTRDYSVLRRLCLHTISLIDKVQNSTSYISSCTILSTHQQTLKVPQYYREGL